MIYYFFLIIGIILNAAAQFILKIAMRRIDFLDGAISASQKIKLFTANPLFWMSLFCYGASFILYSIVLSKIDVSKAYPASSIGGIILLFFLATIFLGESFSVLKLVGAVFCLIGILLVFK
jgi:multidrug transporter EmrE-like cation transporter